MSGSGPWLLAVPPAVLRAVSFRRKGTSMAEKVVFHIDEDRSETLLMALGNIENFLAALPAETPAVVVVANGNAVKLLRSHDAESYQRRIATLVQAGVRFLVCHNALKKLGIRPEELLTECAVIPAGIVEVVRLQGMGYAYVKP